MYSKPFSPPLLYFLGCHRCTVYRGVKLNLKSDYRKGELVVWWPLSSTTDNIEVLSEPYFLGDTGERTIFTIETKSARKIKNYSAIKKENELLLLPGTTFKVKSVLPQGELTMIHLEEDATAPPMIDSGGDDYEEMSPGQFYDLLADAEASHDYATVVESNDSTDSESSHDYEPIGEADDSIYSVPTNAGAKAPVQKELQCKRPSPNGGNCKNKRDEHGDFCKGHSCTHGGCTASKSNRHLLCREHTSLQAAAAAGGVAESIAGDREKQWWPPPKEKVIIILKPGKNVRDATCVNDWDDRTEAHEA